jgi:aerobic carbon-monoxide dehydrogenase large subunit
MIGIATSAELTGIGSRISVAPGVPINTGTQTTTLRPDSTGAVTGSLGVAACGQGIETTLAQVIADEWGVRIEDIRIVVGDNAAVAHGTGRYASRSAVLAGGAAALAARAPKERSSERPRTCSRRRSRTSARRTDGFSWLATTAP